MIDTHAHIYLPEFDEDRQDTLGRAYAAGVQKVYLPNIDMDSIDLMHALVDEDPEHCFPMMGLHPCSVKPDFLQVLSAMEQLLRDGNRQYFGIGECGLDYYWDKTYIEAQKQAFVIQIRLAKQYRLPLIIHSRDALDDCIALVEEHAGADLKGIFHCFSGTAEQLERIIASGFFAGIGGVVTFKNGGLDKVLQPEHLPYLVMETDAPYLAPVPFRGKRNEPAYLTYITERLSDILSVDKETILRNTTANAETVFRKHS